MITEPVSKDLSKLFSNLKEEVSELKEEVSELKDELALQSKNQKLEWAYSNAEYKSFKYYEKDNGQVVVDSKKFVQDIMVVFKQGRGYYITKRSMTPYSGNENEEGEKQFRDALSNQIYYLIGHRPRITLDDNGYAIYYS